MNSRKSKFCKNFSCLIKTVIPRGFKKVIERKEFTKKGKATTEKQKGITTSKKEFPIKG